MVFPMRKRASSTVSAGNSLLRRRLGAPVSDRRVASSVLLLFVLCKPGFRFTLHNIYQVADCEMNVDKMKPPIGLNLAVCNNVAGNVIGARIFCVRTNSHCQI